MRFAITYFRDNVAGKNIADRFRELGFMPQVPIIELEKETLYSELSVENYSELASVDFLVFLSTHRSSKGESALTVHAPGNFRGNELGGEVGKVCMTSAFVCKWLFKELARGVALDEVVAEKYKVTMEATHHGPLCEIPCCFVELGASEEDFRDERAARLLAEVVMSLDKFEVDEKWVPTIGIGGPHYTPNFNEIQLESDYAIGHVIVDYNLPLTDSIIKEAEGKTKEQVKEVLVDWKGCGKAVVRDEVVEVLERNGLKWRRSREAKG
jgi:D-aminoacyl-tRNA deacylase|tara:strand:- start:1312 stop:2115 length:804 start_codon:yes stop_codon:yes gene_type:complete